MWSGRISQLIVLVKSLMKGYIKYVLKRNDDVPLSTVFFYTQTLSIFGIYQFHDTFYSKISNCLNEVSRVEETFRRFRYYLHGKIKKIHT